MTRPKHKNPISAMDIKPAIPEGMESKDFGAVPWCIAFALQAAAWYLRTDIIDDTAPMNPEEKDKP
jgi:hypothetical protein